VRLSAREAEVLDLVAQALSNGQIAARLQLTEATVKRHLRNIFVKLGAVSRLDAVNKAKEWQQQAGGGAARASGGPGRATGR
jgi:ATP/maltotriose-dependent transcriptional regulator MalT